MKKRYFHLVWCLSLSIFILGNDILADTQAQESREAITTSSRSESPVSKAPMPRNEGETPPNEAESDTDPVKDFLGAEIIQIISQPDSVESFQMGSELAKPTVPKKHKLGGFPILKVGPKLNKEQIIKFQKLMLDKGSYLFNVDKRCLFRPNTGLLFLKDKKEVEVLLSFSCASWLFVYDGEGKNQDFDPVYKPLQTLVDALFPAPKED
jgi:hypothetical protein